MSTNDYKMFTNFSRALKYALTEEGIKQVELAKRLDKHRSTVNRWLKTDSDPNESSINEINRALKFVYIDKTLDSQFKIMSTINEVNEDKIDYKSERSAGTISKLEYAQKLITDALFELKHKKE